MCSKSVQLRNIQGDTNMINRVYFLSFPITSCNKRTNLVFLTAKFQGKSIANGELVSKYILHAETHYACIMYVRVYIYTHK